MKLMYEISKHAKERYSERIMTKDNKANVNRFIIENEEKIKTDINKMIEYGELIFQGKQKKDVKTNVISVYVKDLWVILCDTSKELVITLYKIDLGLDEEFNKMYMSRMLEKLNNVKNEQEYHKIRLIQETNNYNNIIEDNTAMINEYKGYIKNLEELNESYANIVKNNNVEVDICQRKIADIVNDLIGKKEF